MSPRRPFSVPAWRRAPGLALAVAWMLSAAVWAERADRDQPLRFTADSLRYDDVRRVNVLTGQVEVTKGTLVLRADRVEVRQSPEGHHSATATGTVGQPAYFRQKRDGVDEHLEGRASRIDYDGRTDTLRLSGQAVIRRLRGSDVADEITGQTITYDNVTETFSVQGGAEGGGDGRVRGVLTPSSGAQRGDPR
ncbi:MAG: lipopolysaccharide transport periplasmic protein LptA [Caldimonas sp.]|uniref:lipopolysaccharide transport periplasmic protein LptA n=1 Tax=Caldimonas sp. TaxID=2838790 RepID=UPI003918C0B5